MQAAWASVSPPRVGIGVTHTKGHQKRLVEAEAFPGRSRCRRRDKGTRSGEGAPFVEGTAKGGHETQRKGGAGHGRLGCGWAGGSGVAAGRRDGPGGLRGGGGRRRARARAREKMRLLERCWNRSPRRLVEARRISQRRQETGSPDDHTSGTARVVRNAKWQLYLQRMEFG